MKDYNKEHYEKQYQTVINYKYKTNTRYQRYLIKLLEKYIQADNIMSVCDIGCGQGLNTALFVNDFKKARVQGIDLSSTGISYAKEAYSGIDRLDFECGNILDYDFLNRTYDLVTAFELLEHIEDWESIAKAMTEVSNRYIMVSAPVGRMRKYETKHGHYRNFKRGELENWFNNNGYKTVKTLYAGFPFWSPITRNLLELIPGDSTLAQENMSSINKCVSIMLYYSYRYFSLVNCKFGGDQFVGLFEKELEQQI